MTYRSAVDVLLEYVDEETSQDAVRMRGLIARAFADRQREVERLTKKRTPAPSDAERTEGETLIRCPHGCQHAEAPSFDRMGDGRVKASCFVCKMSGPACANEHDAAQEWNAICLRIASPTPSSPETAAVEEHCSNCGRPWAVGESADNKCCWNQSKCALTRLRSTTTATKDEKRETDFYIAVTDLEDAVQVLVECERAAINGGHHGLLTRKMHKRLSEQLDKTRRARAALDEATTTARDAAKEGGA